MPRNSGTGRASAVIRPSGGGEATLMAVTEAAMTATNSSALVRMLMVMRPRRALVDVNERTLGRA